MFMRQGQQSNILTKLWPKRRGPALSAGGMHPLDGPPPLGLSAQLAGGNPPALGSDWFWRPTVFTQKDAGIDCHNPARRRDLSADLALYHDADQPDLSLSQKPQLGDGVPPMGLELDIGAFDGSFLSLALALPATAAKGLELRHLIRLDVLADATTQEARAVVAFARLNVQHGPNVEQLVAELSLPASGVGAGAQRAEFDLAYGTISERRIEKLWLDLIFDAPPSGVIRLQDLTLSRCPRAAL